MTLNREAQTAATNTLSAIPFEHLIGAPLVAAISAQAMSARTSLDFIMEVLFGSQAPTTPTTPRKALNVTFSYSDGQGSGEQTLTVPLLTLVPIPFLRIDDMTLQFKATLSGISSTEQQDTVGSTSEGSTSADVGGGFGPWRAKVTASGSVSSKKDSTSSQSSKYSVEYTIDIMIHAVQDDIPAGTAKVLQILNDAINRSATTP